MKIRSKKYLAILLVLIMLMTTGISAVAEVLPEEGELEEELFFEEDLEEDLMGENPDGLDGPEYIDSPEIIEYAKGELGPFNNAGIGLFSTMGLLSNNGDDGNIDEGKPGEIQIKKTASKVDEKDNQWKIELTLEGINIEKTSDIVLVIDTSGSMAGDRMTNAINAAGSFVDSLLKEDGYTRIALVSFESGVTVFDESNEPFKDANGKVALKAAIDGLRADGGTHTQAAIRQARELLNGSQADSKNIVLLSDGDPTYGYALEEDSSYSYRYEGGDNPHKYSEGWITKTYYKDIYTAYENPKDSNEVDFDYTSTIGAGNQLRYKVKDIAVGEQTGDGTKDNRYTQNYDRLYHNSGNAAISESLFAKDDGYTVYTIALNAGDSGTNILGEIASDGKDFTTEQDLESIFQTIAGSISYAARDAVITDPMGDMFSIPGIESVEDIKTLITVNREDSIISWNNVTKTITWTLGTISEIPATMSYIVEIDESAESGITYPTNKETYVEYTNIEEEEESKYSQFQK